MIAMRNEAEEKELARGVRPDSRDRVSLGTAISDLNDATFDVYRDSRGRIILEPKVSVPASEAWLFKNREAAASVQRGLAQLASGKSGVARSVAKYATDDDDQI
jgi:hypothetical protein